ncbi:MAG: acetoin:2,6-dichlorophenolindophenol oxidoreductase subunit alpha [Chloroflexota bacterium]|jgi:TPP-dependent pyruvate/acetoin dehydrogenase alpha subunit|nr:acetoin:2,6-dichlorophenolindophenol oxidoreductase subunit alpha [Chloroflexota bacterium]
MTDAAPWVDLYRVMRLIRRFEEEVQRQFLRGEVYGSTHLCVGQEAVSAGVAPLIGERDWVACTYRGHGHCLALGMDPQALLDELLGRATGTCGGRAGSMNVVDHAHRLIGCFGIVGGTMAAAIGAGLALRRSGGVSVAFFGDGTANQAYFHECLNFAAVMRLPVLFLCENNQYGEFTPMANSTSGTLLARPQAMGIPAHQVDGNDMWAVRAAAEEAFERIREGEGPRFLEAHTYRFSDHGRGDPVSYRPEGEVERWRERDPLLVARRRLASDYGITEEALDAVDRDVDGDVEAMATRALASPFPDPDQPRSEFKGARVAAHG